MTLFRWALIAWSLTQPPTAEALFKNEGDCAAVARALYANDTAVDWRCVDLLK